MRKIILFLALLMVSSAFADEKPGRFFKDQPDVTNCLLYTSDAADDL